MRRVRFGLEGPILAIDNVRSTQSLLNKSMDMIPYISAGYLPINYTELFHNLRFIRGRISTEFMVNDIFEAFFLNVITCN